MFNPEKFIPYLWQKLYFYFFQNLSDVRRSESSSEKTVPAIAFDTLGLFVGSRKEEEQKLVIMRRIFLYFLIVSFTIIHF